jgi:ectoine hydroxylase-related dioxygenase (phytanoyl-CoA dioxygenase family)
MTRTTKANGATRFIPGSHKWPLERVPQESEVVYAEQNIGDTFIFLADVYHGGSANTTEYASPFFQPSRVYKILELTFVIYRDEDRETVGMFYCRGFLRPNETMFLSVSLQQAAQFTPQVQRLLGYGISAPGLGNYEYQDPMRVLFKVEDEETVDYTQ